MKIVCEDTKQFMECVYECVVRGLMFDADASTYTITLSGGF